MSDLKHYLRSYGLTHPDPCVRDFMARIIQREQDRESPPPLPQIEKSTGDHLGPGASDYQAKNAVSQVDDRTGAIKNAGDHAGPAPARPGPPVRNIGEIQELPPAPGELPPARRNGKYVGRPFDLDDHFAEAGNMVREPGEEG